MNADMIRWMIKATSILAAVLSFILLAAMTLSYEPGKILLRAYEELGRSLKEKRGVLNYSGIERYLLQNGAAFHFGRWVNPISYTAVRLTAGVMGMAVGAGYGVIAGAILGAVFFKVPDIMLTGLNNKDNERILPEIKLVYNALSMQIKAGIYVTDALAEVYGSVRDKRLNAALMELSGEIVMKADVGEALERFQAKFNNRYVDTLCIIILQALESGQAVELLSDIAEQIKDMEVTMLNRKKSSLDRSVTFYQLGILTVILVVVLYACITQMFSAALNF